MSDTPPAHRSRVTAIGGGHGLARTLAALRHLDLYPTAIVTVADDGGSSGRLRQQHGIIALGDMRMALQTLAGETGWSRLFGHRFSGGELHGHALGNLALLALIEQHHGDVVAAVAQAVNLLQCRGDVVPCTAEDVTLVARIDGNAVQGQVAVATTPGRHTAVWLEPSAPEACPAAVRAIANASLIVLGPGSLYTSIIPNLLVPGIAAAIGHGAARIVYVANLTSQAGETTGMDLQDHVDALLAHLPNGRDVTVISHDGPEPQTPGLPDQVRSLEPTVSGPQVASVVTADLATRRADGVAVAAHDPIRLAAVLERVMFDVQQRAMSDVSIESPGEPDPAVA